jgi:hypothetical protein
VSLAILAPNCPVLALASGTGKSKALDRKRRSTGNETINENLCSIITLNPKPNPYTPCILIRAQPKKVSAKNKWVSKQCLRPLMKVNSVMNFNETDTIGI